MWASGWRPSTWIPGSEALPGIWRTDACGRGTRVSISRCRCIFALREARRQRRTVDGTRMDWVVVRNRLSMLGSRNKRLVGEGLSELAARLGFRSADGLAERVTYREFFPRGLTALDHLDEATLGTRPSLSHVTARAEVMRLVDALKLPLDARGQRRAAARAEWFAASETPL